MNKLLIHANNTSFTDDNYFLKSEQFEFIVPSSEIDIDFYISDELESGILREKLLKADICFVKVFLTQNYLEAVGLRIAYHIRLTSSLGCKTHLPIILVAEDDIQYLGKVLSLPFILFTEGIYVSNEDRLSFDKILSRSKDGKLKGLNDFDSFLRRITIPPPAGYQSHHSVANEWSILRWSRALGIKESGSVLKVKEKIESLLYYKYLLASFPVTNIDKLNLGFRVAEKGNILLIDDEWSSGWSAIMKEFLTGSPNLYNGFSACEFVFSNLTDSQIIENCLAMVRSANPDIIILDLRLSDSDFKKMALVTDFTGYKILKSVKKINPGIRVVVFTASNKAWNILELQSLGADGFIFKEFPDFNQGAESIISIKRLAATLREQLKYRFQKELFNKYTRVEADLSAQSSGDEGEYLNFIETLQSQLAVIRASIALIDINKAETIDMAFLSCYNFLELFRNYYLRQSDSGYRYVLGIDELRLDRYQIKRNKLENIGEFFPEYKNESPGWFHVQAALSIDYFKFSTRPYSEVLQLRRLADSRNDYIHSDKLHFQIEELESITSLIDKMCKYIRE